MLSHWTTCLNLVRENLSTRLERALDSWRLLRCQLQVHLFADGETRCSRCDAMRVEHWGHWVVLDG